MHMIVILIILLLLLFRVGVTPIPRHNNIISVMYVIHVHQYHVQAVMLAGLYGMAITSTRNNNT